MELSVSDHSDGQGSVAKTANSKSGVESADEFFLRRTRFPSIGLNAFPAQGAGGTPKLPYAVQDNHPWPYRARDLVFVALALPLLLPLFALLFLAVKLNDPSAPVIFVQTRYGLHGRPFRMLKIRTMVPDAEARKVELAHLSEDAGPGFKVDNDPRITRPGRWIRKLYLDELPQLWNVAIGDMTLVGPRANSYPPDTYEPWQLERLCLKPGLTGKWQVMNPKPRSFDVRCMIDIAYIKNRTFFGDFLIILRTVSEVFLRRSGC